MAAHRPDLDEVKPRRIPAKVRYAVAGAVTLVLAVVPSLQPDGVAAARLATVVMVATALGLAAATLLVANLGFRPRIRGHYLEVWTLLGRQSLDLARIAGVRCERSQSGTTGLGLRDDVTDVLITLPVSPQVLPLLRDALLAAGQRGVPLPQRVTRMFNLPDFPGAPPGGGNRMLLIIGVLSAVIVLGAVIGLVASV
ncbi:hypothetical protein [Kribbella sp. NPDC004875]|uniref:hypothetical protein n=1 Tax=Kribbella sp. NPDC004875 TaxID=3364107 RepID=UPI0036A5CC9C